MLTSVLINLVIGGAIFCVVWYLINLLPVPAPFHLLLQVAVLLILILWLVNFLVGGEYTLYQVHRS